MKNVSLNIAAFCRNPWDYTIIKILLNMGPHVIMILFKFSEIRLYHGIIQVLLISKIYDTEQCQSLECYDSILNDRIKDCTQSMVKIIVSSVNIRLKM